MTGSANDRPCWIGGRFQRWDCTWFMNRRRCTMLTILIVLLVLMALGTLPTWPHSKTWGYYPSGGLGLVVLVLILLLLLGRI